EREGAGDARRGGDPAGGVALGTSTRNRVPISREAGGCAEVEAGEEAGDPTRLRAVAGPRQGQRDGDGIAGPDVGPAVAGPGGDGTGAAVRQRSPGEAG